jgi:ABC-type glycerol-3-phosphate transport system substrate-binding protein
MVAAGALVLGAMGGVSAQDEGLSGELTIWTYVPQPEDKLPSFFEDANPNVKINYVEVPFLELPPKLLTAATTGSGPDIVQYNGADAQRLFIAGAITDMDAYWQAYEDRDLYGAGAIAMADGKVIGSQSYANLIALAYNKGILDELGIDVPVTIDEFDAALATIAENSDYVPLQIPGTPAIEGDWIAKPFFAGAGVDYTNLDSAEALAVFEMVESWIKNGYTSPDSVSMSQNDGEPNFLAGNTAFMVPGNWQITSLRDNSDFEVGYVRMPAGPEGSIVYLGGEMLSLGAFGENPDLAWELLRANYYSAEAQAELVEKTGSIPIRGDALALADSFESAIEVYAAAAGDSVALPGGEIGPKQSTAFGDIWNALFAGQLDAAGAQAAAVERVQSLNE